LRLHYQFVSTLQGREKPLFLSIQLAFQNPHDVMNQFFSISLELAKKGDEE